MTTTTNYLWDPVSDSLLLEMDENNDTTVFYNQEPTQYGGVISQHRNAETRYYHTDALGSTEFLTDENGDITDTYKNDAWGNEIAHTGTTENPFRWVGKVGYYWDADLGRYYIRARNYEPIVGRWISVDPLGHIGRMQSLYAYVQNSALNAIDPSGLQPMGARGPLLVSTWVFAKPAFFTTYDTRYYHLCLEATVFKNCCDAGTLEIDEKYQIELLGYSGDGRAPESARVGYGPSGLGVQIIDGNGKIWNIGAFVPKAWGIFVNPGGSCFPFQNAKSPVKRLGPTGFASEEKQCELAKCIVRSAKDVAGNATTANVAYDITRRNSNSFVGELLRRCGGHVADDFVTDYINNAPGVFNDFSRNPPPFPAK